MYSIQFTARNELLHCVQVKASWSGSRMGSSRGHPSCPRRASEKPCGLYLRGQVAEEHWAKHQRNPKHTRIFKLLLGLGGYEQYKALSQGANN